MTLPLNGEGSESLQSSALLVTLPLGSQSQSPSLMVIPLIGCQSLLVTLCCLRGKEGLRHSLGSLSEAFHVAWSRLPHCRLWATWAEVDMLTA